MAKKAVAKTEPPQIFGDMPDDFLLTPEQQAKREAIDGELVQPPTPDETPQVDQEPTQPAELVHQPPADSVLSIVGGISTAALQQALEVQTEQRKLIQQFIRDNLVVDIDYGKIHVVKNCRAEDKQRGSCTTDYHYSKSVLFKPGQEKIFSLFGITDELVKDTEAYEMLAGVPGLVAYKCIMHRGPKRIGEGRGAATLSGTQNDPNSTIKKAEKRARMDACLSLGFSAYFTQDLDDPEYAGQRDAMNRKAAAEAERREKDEFGLMPRDPELPVNDAERQILGRIILKMGFSDSDDILELLKANGVQDPQNMTSGEARGMMSKLTSNMFAPITPKPKPAVPDIDIDEPVNLDNIPEDMPPEPAAPTPSSMQEPLLVVDDDLKNYIMNLTSELSLNGRGLMWLHQTICGRPFAKWVKMDDKEWRRAYEVVQGIADGTFDVPEQYLTVMSEPTPPPIDITEPMRNQLDETVHEVFPGAEVMK